MREASMATKADRFRWEAERSGPKRQKQPPRPRRDRTVNTALPGVSATDRKGMLPHKESAHADQKATYVLEDSTGGPSRRSSRKASNRQRTDGKMIAERRISLSRPSAPSGARRGR
jgi:hypothetical protein